MTSERRDSTVTGLPHGGGGAPPLGTQLGPYRLEHLLGTGGMGEVYRARDSRLERDVAIKVIRAGRRDEDHLQHRLSREARAISALNHPHICNVYDINEQDGQVYLVMEYIEGRTLAAVLQEGLLPLDHALRYGEEIAAAAAAAHAKGIVDRRRTSQDSGSTSTKSPIASSNNSSMRADIRIATSGGNRSSGTDARFRGNKPSTCLQMPRENRGRPPGNSEVIRKARPIIPSLA
jgi:hypothetical protein